MIPSLHPRERTARLVAQLVDAWNSHDPERAAALYADEFEGIDVGDATTRHGRQGAREWIERYLCAFPDLYFEQKELLLEEDRVVLHWTAHGTHNGPLMHIPPTGRRIEVQGMSLMKVEGDQVRRGVYIWDVAGLLRSIGLLPEL